MVNKFKTKVKKMSKNYTVTQKLTLNGQLVTRTFPMYGADSDVTALVALLEGEITVKEVNTALGRTGGSDTNTTSYNTVSKISLGFDNDGDYTSKHISSYDGRPIIFKNSAGSDDIQSALANAQMLKGNTTEKPKTINAYFTGTSSPTKTTA
jgi:hypothetical protein